MPELADIRLRRLVHELNTPVGVGAMAASMLPAQIDRLTSELDSTSSQHLAGLLEEWREAVALVQNSLQLCIRILGNSVPAHTNLGAEPLPLLDLPATLNAAVQVHLARRSDLQVSCLLHFTESLRIHADGTAWQQVIGNLVANSLLHGFDGRSKGAISISGTLLPGSRILVHYCDDGVGLNDEVRARLFEDGFSTRLHSGGHGLGMGIVQDLVHNKMGGRLQVHRPAKGVHISIETPC